MPVLAIGGVDLIVLLVGLAAILILTAAWVFFKPIAAVLRHVPFVGGTIANTVSRWLLDAIKAVAGSFDALVHGTAHLFWALGVGIWHLTYQTVQSLTHLTFLAQWAGNIASQALSTASGVAAALPGEIAGAITQAETFAEDQVTQAITGLNSVITADIAGVESDLTGAINTLEQALASGLAGAQDALNAGLNALEGDIAVATDQVLSEANTLFGEAEAAITTLGVDVAALPAEIEGTIPGIIDGIVPGIIAGAIPGILSQVIPRVTTLEGEFNECVEPLCDTVTPNAKQLGDLGKLLQGLEGLAEVGALMALLVAAVEDPKGTAGVVEETMGWVAPLSLDLVHAVGDAAGVVL